MEDMFQNQAALSQDTFSRRCCIMKLTHFAGTLYGGGSYKTFHPKQSFEEKSFKMHGS